jgi:hypothetical protein
MSKEKKETRKTKYKTQAIYTIWVRIIKQSNSFNFYLVTCRLNSQVANNSVQFFIIYVPSQQRLGQLQTQHRVDTGNYIMGKHNKKSKTNYKQALEEKEKKSK